MCDLLPLPLENPLSLPLVPLPLDPLPLVLLAPCRLLIVLGGDFVICTLLFTLILPLVTSLAWALPPRPLLDVLDSVETEKGAFSV